MQEGVEISFGHSGVVYVNFDDAGAWKMKVGQELNAAGFTVAADRVL